MAINFPDSPTIGDEFTGGGFTWVWDGASWSKLAATAPTTSSNGFALFVGDTGNTTYVFPSAQPAGSYSISSELGDVTYDIYFVASDFSNVGYSNGVSLEASGEFTRVVVYGSTTDDVLTFEYKASVSPTGLGDVTDGAAPFLTSATPTTLETIDDTTTVTGGNFATDVEIIFTGQDAVDRVAKNVVRSSSTSLIVTRPDDFPADQGPYTMRATNAGITNPSLNVNQLNNYFSGGSGVTWVTTSPLDTATVDVAYSVTLEATDGDGGAISYAVTTGTLPAGLSLNGSTGVISGTPTASGLAVFTVTATDSGGNTSAREFQLDAIELSVQYLVVAGGAGTGAGGGGAGGYRSSVIGENSGGGATAEPVFLPTPLTSYTVSVGSGGAAETNGVDSTFATITSLGGGHGQNANPSSGGSGGGAGGGVLASGAAGTPNQGFDGGSGGAPYPSDNGGGGGGAGAIGGAGASGNGGNGGIGVASSITGTSIYRAGGGGGQSRNNYVSAGGNGGGGNGGNAGGGAIGGTAGTVNTGGGAGGGYDTVANGGSGVVILKYQATYSILAGPGLVFSTTTSGDYKISIFTSGTDTIQFAVASSLVEAEYLVVAGGGGGGWAHGAGGGAGGYRSSVSGENSGRGASAESVGLFLPSTNYTVTVGAGGPAGDDSTLATDCNGSNSIFGSITSLGGGGGGGYSQQNSPSGVLNGAAGGSGGGSWGTFYGYRAAGTSDQGYDGGIGTGGGAYAETTGGGGGAAGQGGDGVSGTKSGNGGAGVTSSITGIAVTRGGGGGGGNGGNGTQTPGSGGAGGGGRGGYPQTDNVNAEPGFANTGGGGGGGSYIGALTNIGFAGNGGSGVVIARFSTSYTISASAGLVYSLLSTGGKNVAVFTAGTGTIQFVPVSETAVSTEYLVIAGGGGGGNTTYDTYGGGGGGAGGYRAAIAGETSGGNTLAEIALPVELGTAYTVTVGAGGTGGGATATNGANSVLAHVIALGGGRGAGFIGGTYGATDGGSGGGGGGAGAIQGQWGAQGNATQGFRGGKALRGSSPYGGGGGGGASAAGTNAIATGASGSGGNGLASSITGVATTRGGGGAGGTYVNPGHGVGTPGTGGGGTAGMPGGNGGTNTGGGGGGASYNPNGSNSGNGGSGIIVIRYPSARTLTVGAGLTHSTSTIGANKVTIFTAGTDTITMS